MQGGTLSPDVQQVYVLERPKLVAWLGRHGRPREDAEDIVQDVFVEVARNRFSFEGPASFSTLLHDLAGKRASKSDRHGRLIERVRPLLFAASGGGAPTPEDEFERLERVALVRRAMAKLSRRHADVIGVVYMEGMDPEVVRKRMGVSPGAFRLLLYRAREALRAEVEGLSEHLASAMNCNTQPAASRQAHLSVETPLTT